LTVEALIVYIGVVNTAFCAREEKLFVGNKSKRTPGPGVASRLFCKYR
jgi:hypothetical protein